MVKPVRILLVSLCLLLVMIFPACSSSKSPSTNQSAVTFTMPKNSGVGMDQGQTVNVQVTVSPDPGSKGVMWKLQNASDNNKPAGTLTNVTSTSATYNAPPNVSAQTQVNVIATSVGDSTQSASLSVVIEPPPSISAVVPTPLTSCPNAGSVIVPGVGAVANVGTSYVSTFTVSSGTSPYTWATTGALPDGLTIQGNGATQATISGTPTSAGCQQVSVQVTDAVGTTSTPMNFVMLVVPSPLSPRIPNIVGAYVSPNPPNNGVPYPPTPLSANGGVPAYSWSLQSGSVPPPGLTISNTGLLAGTPSAQGLSQNGGLGSYSFTALVHDTQLPYPAVGLANLTIGVNYLDSTCHTGAEASLNSQEPYAFLLRGFDNAGPVVIAGSFSADGTGKITGGVEDISRSGGVQSNLTITAAGSSYAIGSDNRGCLTLANSAGTTTTFRISLGACSTSLNQQKGGCQPGTGNAPGYFTRGRLIEFDDSNGSGTRGSGIIRLQDSSAFTSSGLSGMYAFGLAGWDSSGSRYAMAGSASASSGAFSSVAADINDGGSLGSALTGGSGTYAISASRGTGTLTAGSASLDLAIYPITAKDFLFVSTDALSSSHPMIAGEALSTAGPFSTASLPNSYLLHMSGLTAGAPDPNLGVLTFDGLSTFAGPVYENQGGTLGTTALSATYAVDSTSGRLTVSAPQSNQNLGPHPFVAYIIPTTSGTAGFVVSTDASAQAGALEFQALNPPPSIFLNANVVGQYFLGTEEDLDASSVSTAGTTSATGTGNQAGNEDFSSLADGLLPNQGFTGGYSVSKTGTGNFGGETVSITNGKVVYALDESLLDLHPTITVAEQ